MRKGSYLLIVLALLMGASLIFPNMVQADPDKPHVVHVEFETVDQLATLAAQLDIWHVDHEAGTLVALVTPAERAALEADGYRVWTDQSLSAHPDAIPGYPCYRTIDELYAQIEAWESQYPHIARLTTIGYSHEGRPLKMMRLTRRSKGGEKPVFFLMANIHGRELITNEVVMVYVQYLLENYGSDPDVTWLLDAHDIYVLVSANPDGHVKNEPGEPWAWWRKNTNPANGSCGGSGGKYGVDLNRNSSFKWGGASTDPCDETYQGPSAASETETQAVQSFIRSIFEDQRGPGDTDAAPDDTTGVFITLHSYSNLVLWPWGHTYTDAPNASQLRMLGEKMASYNGYVPEQASDLYPTTGSTDEWSYGELGIASYTFEIGSYGDGFYPPCSRYDALVQPNIPALLYAAKVARAPYMTSFGPDALEITVTPDSALAGEPLQVQAILNDEENGAQTIAAAEAYVGTPPWDGGIAHPLTAVDGAFNETVESVRGLVDTTGLPEGRYLVYVRGQDSGGNWGPVSAFFVDIADDSSVAGAVTAADTDQPLAGAVVSALNASYVYSTTTGEAGEYRIPLHAGTYTMTAKHFGYETEATSVTATSGMTATQDFALARLPWGELTVVVNELGTGAGLEANIEIEGSPLTLTTHPSVTVELPAGVYTVTASTELGHEMRHQLLTIDADGHLTHVFRLPPPPPLLVVDDDAGENYEDYLLPHLEAFNLPYDLWEIESLGTPSADFLSRYDGLLWSTGDDRMASLNVSEQTALELYLNQGGRLLLSGQNIGVDIRNDPGHFYRDMLRATFVQDDAGHAVRVMGGGPYDGLSADLWNGSGADNQDSPDVLAPYDASASSVFTYTSGGSAGLAVERDGYRLLYLGYGLEGVGDANARAEILRRCFVWLDIASPPAQLLLEVASDLQEIPRGGSLTYSVDLFNDSLMAVSDGALTVSLPVSTSVLAATPTATLLDQQLHWDEITLASEAQTVFSWTLRLAQDYVGETLTQTVEAWWPKVLNPAKWPVVTPVGVSGVTLAPSAATKTDAPGGTLTYTLTLTNTGNVTGTFDVTLTDYAWMVALTPETVGPLAPGASAALTLTVTIPTDAGDGDSDTVTVTAASQGDPQETASLTVTTTVAVRRIYLPLVLRTSPDP